MQRVAYLTLFVLLVSSKVSKSTNTECADIESKYGHIGVTHIINSKNYGVENVISCANTDRQEVYTGRDVVFESCPSENLTSIGYLYVQTVINEACIARHRLHSLVQEWLETDIFGSPYVVRDGFQITTECTKDGIQTYLDQSVKGDLRTSVNSTSVYVKLRQDKYHFTDETDLLRIVAVLEPVWAFVDRVLSNKDLSPLSFAMGEEQSQLHVVTERTKTVAYSINKVSYDHPILAVYRIPAEAPAAVYQSYDCTSCVEEKIPQAEKCVSESQPLSDECGRIVGECASSWWAVKSICAACQIPM